MCNWPMLMSNGVIYERKCDNKEGDETAHIRFIEF